MPVEEIWAVYKSAGSLRAAGKLLGMNHMSIRNRLVKAGYELEKKSKENSTSPNYKVYVRPDQYETLTLLAEQRGFDGKHAFARHLLDLALEVAMPGWKSEPIEKVS